MVRKLEPEKAGPLLAAGSQESLCSPTGTAETFFFIYNFKKLIFYFHFLNSVQEIAGVLLLRVQDL